jgi:hypothetical protein
MPLAAAYLIPIPVQFWIIASAICIACMAGLILWLVRRK